MREKVRGRSWGAVMKAFLLALGASVALAAPALARDYVAVSAQEDNVEYLDPTTVKTDGDIKTFWAYTVFIRTTNLGIDFTSQHMSVDCKNNRYISLAIIGYRMNGDVVGSTDDDPNIQHRWIDIPPETRASTEEDAVCHGHDLGTDSGADFSEVVPVARRRLIQIAAAHPQPGQAMQQTSTPPPAWRSMLRQLGRAMQQASTPPPTYSSSDPGTGQPVYSPSGAETEQTVYSPSECVGPIVAGVCHGAILPNQATHPVCHGQMVNGTCTGPMF
jgi:hypothetical protein